MSKNIRDKPQVKTLTKTDGLKKTSTLPKSTTTSKLPSKTITLSKDEEKKKGVLRTTAAHSIPLKRLPLGSKTKTSPAKLTSSKSVSTTVTKGPRTLNTVIPEKRNQSFKAKYSPSTLKSVPDRPSSSKPNLVMSTIHNVTVSSPPSKRKQVPIEPIFEKEEPISKSSSTTIILKDKPAEINRELHNVAYEVPVKVKEPVSFEVVFNENQKHGNSDPSSEYDDDFESYESDFETGSSSGEVGSDQSSLSEPVHENPPSTNESETEPEGQTDDDDEESELTQFPITVIQRDKEQERKLDSGNYDLHSKKRQPMEPFDSLDTLANYEQLDSGISYENSMPIVGLEPETLISENNNCNTSFDPSQVFGGYSRFYSKPRITKRGVEIMSKIQLDTITFTLLDLKPIAYDTYMQMFGSSNTVQSATQTKEDRMESDCQTDELESRSIWTQFPPHYDIVYGSTRETCTGELTDDDDGKVVLNEDPLDGAIKVLSKFRQKSILPNNASRHKTIDFERLNIFLNNTIPTISNIISSRNTAAHTNTTELPLLSRGFYKLNTKLLNALKVVRVFANCKFNFVLTVHESIDNVYHNDFSNLIMVWNSSDTSKPVRLLSTWSEVCRAEICNESSDIVVCGLRDGSVAMWDLRETYSFCSKLDGYLTHFSATHSITPTWRVGEKRSSDMGAMVDVRSFRSLVKTTVQILKTIQFASLNETGILTIWTLVETSFRNYEMSQESNLDFEYSSPWARVKLVQSAICDLREYIELGTVRPKSAFERTKLNFQKQIFEDDILKELAESKQDMKLGLQGLRFINLDCGTEFIFVGTNRNFIISCTKALKRERLRKISIVDNGFLFPTAIKLLQNESYLVVGLSNGSVILLNCNQEKVIGTSYSQNLENPRREGTAKTRSNEFDFEIGKSCAIQNIIRNERNLPQSNFTEHEYRPNTSTFISAAIGCSKKPFEMRVFDEQVLLNGSVLRKNLVQHLEVSSDGWTLFALSDGDVRVYDFYTDAEVPFSQNPSSREKINEIASNRGNGDEMQLVMLNHKNIVQVHLLK